jgi:hypothetical protein
MLESGDNGLQAPGAHWIPHSAKLTALWMETLDENYRSSWT